MGYRVLLIAVTGKSPEVIHSEFGVTPTEQYEDIPESPVTGAMLPTGSYLLYVHDEIVPDDRQLAQLSTNASVVACYANETVMNSFTASWVNGVEQWSVLHDASESIHHLKTTGAVPDQLKTIQAKLSAEQEDEDGVDFIYEIPIELFAAFGGMRYNEDIEGADPEPWQVLARPKKKSSWWPFGKK